MENIILTNVKNTKTIKSLCVFWPSADCLLYSHKIYNTLLLEFLGSFRNLEAKIKFLKLQIKFGDRMGAFITLLLLRLWEKERKSISEAAWAIIFFK
jgi:hypothetical protein